MAKRHHDGMGNQPYGREHDRDMGKDMKREMIAKSAQHDGMRERKGMIRDDRSQPANLPDKVMDITYPNYRGMGGGIPDLYDAVSEQMRADETELARHDKPRKY